MTYSLRWRRRTYRLEGEKFVGAKRAFRKRMALLEQRARRRGAG
jgi:hypothetical protein